MLEGGLSCHGRRICSKTERRRESFRQTINLAYVRWIKSRENGISGSRYGNSRAFGLENN